MRVKIFTLNENNKIEFTQEELEKLLDETYNDGYADGKKSNYFYYRYPYYTTPAVSVGSDSTFVTGTTIGSGDYKTATTTSATTCKSCKK